MSVEPRQEIRDLAGEIMSGLAAAYVDAGVSLARLAARTVTAPARVAACGLRAPWGPALDGGRVAGAAEEPRRTTRAA